MNTKSTTKKKSWKQPQLSVSYTAKLILAVVFLSFAIACSKKEKRILVFSKTEGYRHASIEPGVEALKKLGAENGFKVTATEDVRYMVEDSLKQFASVV